MNKQQQKQTKTHQKKPKNKKTHTRTKKAPNKQELLHRSLCSRSFVFQTPRLASLGKV